ncbi:hypothetical protein XANCAGTX0491_003507 [Xanthoria calcicola]
MPFHPYRPQRVPDRPFNRPQGPMQMPPKQPHPQSGKVFSYDVAASGMTYKPVYQPARPCRATPVENAYATPPLTNICTPDSFSMGSTYLPSSVSPETADPSDMWGSPFDFNNINEQHFTHQDFGLGLGPLGSDMVSTAFNKVGEMNRFPYPSLLNEVETLAFDPGSPDGQSWSSLSEASAGLSSDMADCSPSTHEPTVEPEFPADLDAFFRSANTTPSVPPYSFAQPPSHCRAESAPRHSFRTSPYPTDFGRGRSFSAGSPAMSRTQRASNYIQTVQQVSEHGSHHSSPLTATHNMDSFADHEFEMYCRSNQGFTAETDIGTPSAELASFGVGMFGDTAQTSPELVNVLQSNGSEGYLCEHHFSGPTGPPDLFGPLSEEPSSPPPEDFDCDESQMPRAQDLRFEGDMYTPRYVRGHGNKREGWCGTCKPGRWLVLKNSAFWYDKSFSHGISAATGSPFEGPRETRRMKGNPDVWEGLCGSCNDWIALISSKKKGTTWFRHAYKCHTHQKVKDTTKRRREVTQGRTAKAAKASSLKNESREQSPFSMAPLNETDETDIHGGGDAVSSLAGTI